MTSGETDFSFSDFEMILYYLRRISTVISKRQGNDGEVSTVPNSLLIYEINMKLMRLGRIPYSHFEKISQKGELLSDAERSTRST